MKYLTVFDALIMLGLNELSLICCNRPGPCSLTLGFVVCQESGRRRPRLTVRKYAGGRQHPNTVMDIDPRLRDTGLSLLSSARSANTWKASNSAMNVLRRLENTYDIDLSFPWSQQQLANYIVSCSLEGHKASTVQSNLSHIRMSHRLQGMQFSADGMTSRMLLTGLRNSVGGGLKRLAMSPRLLILSKHRLKATNLPTHDKLMIWTIFTWLFFGSFRSSEILCNLVSEFSDTSLTADRISWTDSPDGFIEVSLHHPKEARNREPVKVELLSLPQKVFCPVLAFHKWRRVADRDLKLEAGMPVFRFLSGALVTGSFINKLLKKLLSQDVNYEDLGVYCHSFRAGLVCAMARMGMSEEKCKIVGRWRSSCWLKYAKEGRAVRKEDMLQISRLILAAASMPDPTMTFSEDDCRVSW